MLPELYCEAVLLCLSELYSNVVWSIVKAVNNVNDKAEQQLIKDVFKRMVGK